MTVRHDTKRLVERVGYVTRPGHAVRMVVTTHGVLERQSAMDPFRLVSVMGRPGETLQDAVAAAVAGCGWALEVAPDVKCEPVP